MVKTKCEVSNCKFEALKTVGKNLRKRIEAEKIVFTKFGQTYFLASHATQRRLGCELNEVNDSNGEG